MPHLESSFKYLVTHITWEWEYTDQNLRWSKAIMRQNLRKLMFSSEAEINQYIKDNISVPDTKELLIERIEVLTHAQSY